MCIEGSARSHWNVDKHGIDPEELMGLVDTVLHACPHLRLKGLMTIGSTEHSATIPNPDFAVRFAVSNVPDRKYRT